MTDQALVQLYWDRNELAISATAEKYGKYCTSIAKNILGSDQDVEECVNDTYLNAWNAIPPNRPNILSAFLGKITRNLSFSRYKHNRAAKRGGGQLPMVLEELAECIPDNRDVEQEISYQELVKSIDCFLDSVSQQQRNLFVRRYWYSDSIVEIAARQNLSEAATAMTLSRVRTKLQKYLRERGF